MQSRFTSCLRSLPVQRLGRVLVAGFISAVPACALGQTWTLTTAPASNWNAVACSADGSRIVAASGIAYPPAFGCIYLSTNSGATWFSTSAPSENWSGVACSADGTRLAATVGFYGGPIYLSTDSGATWEQSGAQPTNAWVSICSSADGLRLAAIAVPRHYISGEVDVSIDGGLTWARSVYPDYSGWAEITCSADGVRLVGGSYWGTYISTNGGGAWDATGGPAAAVASSADGRRLLATRPSEGNGERAPIRISKDWGATWETTSAPSQYWVSVASSADGTRLVAAAAGTYTGYSEMYVSTDSGQTWLPTGAPTGTCAQVTSSADGCKFVAVMKIDTYQVPGRIFTWQRDPAPELSVTSADGAVDIAWVIPSRDFVLEHNSDLQTTNWTIESASPILNLANLQNVVRLPVGVDGARFYRLRSR
jgi:hypothetical protein